MDSNLPSRKITAAGLGGAITVVLVWAFHPVATIPPEVASAITTIVTVATGYFVKDAT